MKAQLPLSLLLALGFVTACGGPEDFADEEVGQATGACAIDASTLLAFSQKTSMTGATSRHAILPGSNIKITGSGFKNYQRATIGRLTLELVSYQPNGDGSSSPRIDTTTSWLVDSDTELTLDVPRTVLRGTGIIRMTVENTCSRLVNGRWVTVPVRSPVTALRPVTFAPPDQPVEAVSDLRVSLVGADQLRLDWSDIRNERNYSPAFRRIGATQWNSINWLQGAVSDLPANSTTVTLNWRGVTAGVSLEAREAYEFVVFSRNLQSGATSNIASLVPRDGRVTVTASPPPLGSTLCAGSFRVTGVDAYFDQDGDGVVAAIEQAGDVPFPLFPTADISARHGYWNQPGRTFAANADGLRANTIVVARFFGCGPVQPQFVAAHLRVERNRDGSLTATPILMLAGDELADFSRNGELIHGVVMTGTFDGTFDAAAFSAERAVGAVTGSLSFGASGGAIYGARVAFTFDTPIERR